MEQNQENGLAVINQNTGLETKEQKELRLEFLKEMEKFTKTLNQAPNPIKIKKHEGADYLPISVVEKDLDKVYFGAVQYEIISYQQILNEFVVHARIKVLHPVLRQWLNYDGIGAGMFQQKAGTPIQDFFIHKLKNSGKITVPNAYASAIKNAAKKIGKRFGSDLNRLFEDDYKGYIKDNTEGQDDGDNKPLNK